MIRKIEEKFSQEREGVGKEGLGRGYTLLASEVAEWWRGSQMLQQALWEVIRELSEEGNND